MTTAWTGAASPELDLPALEELLCAAVEDFSGRMFEAREAAELAQRVEALAKTIGRAQIAVAQIADRADVAGLGMSGRGAGGRSEYRSTADFLSQTLLIPFGEARRRLGAAEQLLPRQSMTGEPLPAIYPTLARAVQDGEVCVGTAQLILKRLDDAAPVARQLPSGGMEEMAAMETSLTQTARQAVPETVRRTAERWLQAIDQDGMEPSEATKRQHMGLFDRGRRFGLRHFELFTDDLQAEKLLAASLPAGNPRTGSRSTTGAEGADADPNVPTASSSSSASSSADGMAAATQDGEAAEAPEDPRSRQEKLLGGLIFAVDAALATSRLPRNGGHRPQIMVTIDYRTLLDQTAPPGGRTSEAAIEGQIHPRHIRQLACVAEIIPVVMGKESQVLDVGRSERLFTPEQLKVLYARDRGCSFPGCSVHAFMTEAHHILPWSEGGPTDLDNGVLACSFHHHLAHAGDWKISVAGGVPFWIPPLWVDPAQPRLRNTYFHPEVRAALVDV